MNEVKLDFVELCKIKRERLKLSKQQVCDHAKVTSYYDFENRKRMPSRKTKQKLIEFFKISEEELLKLTEKTEVRHKEKPIETIIRLIDDLIDKTTLLQLNGKLGKSIKEEALNDLNLAREAVKGLDILDRLL